MKERNYLFDNLTKRQPLSCLFELTYRCNLDCLHCYCKGSEDIDGELKTQEVKDILDELHQEGCLYIGFTGGEPFIREDFLDIYLYAKRKGFLINIFTNGTLINKEIIRCLKKYPPRDIEITLNGITEESYEAITQIKGSFKKVMAVIDELLKLNMPLVIKSNCLKQNKDEIAKIKRFTKRLLGEDKKRFKFDPFIFPRLNRDRTPCNHRLSPEELREVMESDLEIYNENEIRLHSRPQLKRDRSFLYQCSAWLTDFFINPYGRLKFCELIERFSVDLRKASFREGFYDVFPKLLKEKFKTNSKCKDCQLRPICYHCPGRAYLETGDEEAAVPYFCELAKFKAEQMELNCQLK